MKKASKQEMRGALELAARWLGTDDATATFEDIGDWFYKDTGLLRPGKSMPVECDPDEEHRSAAFREWAKKTDAQVRRAISEALR